MPNESDEEIPIALYNPISGLRTDIDNLMDRFSKTESVRFDEFSKVWKGMKFSLIFAGRQDDRECREVRFNKLFIQTRATHTHDIGIN